MNKVYLVISEWALNGEEFGSDASVHITYDGAKAQFENVKQNMKDDYAEDYDELGNPIFNEDENIVEIDDEEEYSIYPEGRWSENHDSVRIKECILQR